MTRLKLATGLVLATLALAMTACLPVPLGDPAASRVDPSLAGLWLHEDVSQNTLVAIYPVDDRVYVVESVTYEQQGGQPAKKSRALCKAWLTDVKGQTFMTLEALAQRLPQKPGDNAAKVYPVFRLSRDGADGLGARVVRESFAPLKTAKTPADVAAVIAREMDNPDLYGGPVNFRRLDPARDADAIAGLSKLFE